MPTRSTNRPFLVAALAFAAALAPVGVGAWLLHESAMQRDQERFSRLLAAMQSAVAREDQRYLDFLRSVGVECAAGMTTEQWKWRRTTDEWPERFPQLRSVGWAQNTADLQGAETRFLASRESAVAAPLALGKEDAWRRALEQALARGTTAAAGVPTREDAAMMVFVPVRSKAPGGGVAGFALGELRWRALVTDSVSTSVNGQLTWEILGLHDPSTPTAPATQDIGMPEFGKAASARLAATSEFWHDSQRQQPWLILVCGVPLACAVAWVAALQSKRRAALETRVAERTAELRSAHDRLAEALTHERELNAMKTNFISMVTHELRTPLSVVQSSTDILSRYLERLPGEKREEHFRAISHAVLRITDLSDEVLLFSRFESQRVQLKVAPLALEPLCTGFVREVLSATSDKCPITFISEPSLPAAYADERLLRHVLVNLLGNAAKYSPAGFPVSLKLSRRGEHAIFVIEDRGMGISATEQARLFHSFHRGANVEHLPGTGLGLVIVKRCVELHGGTIALKSAEGQGTTVTVDLPIFTQPKPDPTP